MGCQDDGGGGRGRQRERERDGWEMENIVGPYLSLHASFLINRADGPSLE